ncbi:MAG: type IV pili twitching motility protein PilT [Bdellovibrionales bacterium RIFOXYA1_FULL_36_14]|nr:MAG: type IV pili twitching motility protein PilT [Bdellovibrionales bacterium RIFOXYA1_FULL_36_14]
MVENGASDLHITAGVAPALRVNGEIVRVKIPPLTPNDTKRIVYQILSEDQKNEFEKKLELDLSFGIKGLARFRSNVFYSKGAIAAAFRLVPTIIPDFKSLKLPSILLSMTDIDSGLILVTGPTGSGKSTTLASLLDRLNEKELAHIVTVEDPIEFVHTHKKCIVNQREVGSDTNDFSDAMRSLLRQDPDIILIGELRDKETVEAAIKIAETGHLVFGTLHTNSCVQTINRLVNVFPADQQDQIRTLLSFVLQGIVSQRLIKKSFEPGRVVSIELMMPNIGIRNLIRENKIHQLYSQMQTGQERSGMITMNQSLFKLVEAGIITAEVALLNTTVPEELKQMLGIKEKDGYE